VARDEFQLRVEYSKDLDACWAVLCDVASMTGWISMLSEVTEHEPLSRYTAKLKDRIGPFSVAADLDIEVRDVQEPYEATITGEGADRHLRSRLRFSAHLKLAPVDGGGTTAAVDGWYEVVGNVAGLGDGMIHRKAKAILCQFEEGSRRELG
jgi:carbon monoxide dehydrogenase subunit G